MEEKDHMKFRPKIKWNHFVDNLWQIYTDSLEQNSPSIEDQQERWSKSKVYADHVQKLYKPMISQKKKSEIDLLKAQHRNPWQ